MTAFGIDLGTTNSCIAYVDESGETVIVPSAIGDTTTPSVVYFDRREKVMVGQAAKNSAQLAPDLSVEHVKRQMGQEGVEYTFHGVRYTPESISALILKELTSAAQRHLTKPVGDVVITIPAHFGVAEREATRRAGEIAGLNVLDLLEEPVAAALSYRGRAPVRGTRHLLVYDLGGGTFDTAVVRLDGDHVEVICKGGDPCLGGADWDSRIREFLVDAFTEQYPRLDPTADPVFRQEVWIWAEQFKEQLSSTRARRRNFVFGRATARVELSRERLEELTADLLERTFTGTEETIAVARDRGVPELDEIVLVGGMTRMPAIRARLEKLLGKPPRRHEPDLAVVRGAAMFAKLGQTEQRPGRLPGSTPQTEKLRSQQVTTVLPRGVGVKVPDINDPRMRTNPLQARQYVVHLIPAGTPLPADSGPVTFQTWGENQPGVEIEIWEQTSRETSEELADNALVGRGKLLNLHKLPQGSPIEVTLFVNERGLLTVRAVEPASGRQVTFELRVGGMNQNDVDRARQSVARHDTGS
ncbi:Hsp70 family protein [Nonomuraea sp. NPDC059007]|uniref:Hsp70 family protein n=1 Tax=Nonomuraea sp. NPDC059007 TaxID=3346692 RepID=UPI0036C20AF2